MHAAVCLPARGCDLLVDVEAGGFLLPQVTRRGVSVLKQRVQRRETLFSLSLLTLSLLLQHLMTSTREGLAIWQEYVTGHPAPSLTVHACLGEARF